MVRLKRIGYSGEWEAEDCDPKELEKVVALLQPTCGGLHLWRGKRRPVETINGGPPAQFKIKGTRKDVFPWNTIVVK